MLKFSGFSLKEGLTDNQISLSNSVTTWTVTPQSDPRLNGSCTTRSVPFRGWYRSPQPALRPARRRRLRGLDSERSLPQGSHPIGANQRSILSELSFLKDPAAGYLITLSPSGAPKTSRARRASSEDSSRSRSSSSLCSPTPHSFSCLFRR